MGSTVRITASRQDLKGFLIILSREAWRYTGPFTRRNRFRGLFPGFGIAVVAFAAYSAFEYAFLDDGHSHSKHEAKSH